jgi:hypothetical protein
MHKAAAAAKSALFPLVVVPNPLSNHDPSMSLTPYRRTPELG